MRFYSVNVKDTHVSIYKYDKEVWHMDVPTVINDEEVRLKMRITSSDRIDLFKRMKGKTPKEMEQMKEELAARYKEKAEKDPFSGIIEGKYPNHPRKMSILQYSSDTELKAMNSMTSVLQEVFKDDPFEENVTTFSKMLEKINARVNDLHSRPEEEVQLSGSIYPSEMEKLTAHSLQVMLLLTSKLRQWLTEKERLSLQKELNDDKEAAAQQAASETHLPEHHDHNSQLEHQHQSSENNEEDEGETEEERKKKAAMRAKK